MIKKIFTALILAVIYGFLNYWTLDLRLPGAAAEVSFRPQILIPLLGGFLMGPLWGFIIGGAGNFIGDWLGNVSSIYWMFSLGNGIMGAIMGIPILLRGRSGIKVESGSDFSCLLLLIIASNIIGIGTGFFIYNQICADSLAQLTWLFFHPILVSNIIVGYVLFPPVLFTLKGISGTFDIKLCISQLYLIIFVTASVVYATYMTGFHSIQTDINNLSLSRTEDIFLNIFRFGGTIGITVAVLSIGLSFFLTGGLLRPIRRLMDSAEKLKRGDISQIDTKSFPAGNDPLGKLSQIFLEAVDNVRIREDKLRSEIERLQVVINRDQEDKQVQEITESDYFMVLREKSRHLRDMKDRKKHEEK